MKGQLSAEMLILIAVVLAIVALVAHQLMTTAQDASDEIGDQSDAILGSADEFSKAKEGEFCAKDEDCLSGQCSDNACN